MTRLPTRACWTAEAASEVLKTEALANREGAFLAVHQPFTDLHVGGTQASDVEEPTDEGVLRAISRPEKRHVFCVVEGEPGAGKSHLIRWLKVKWPKHDLVLLIQRADGSLPGALRELERALGDSYGHLFRRLGQHLRPSFEGQVEVFKRMLAVSMQKGHFSTPPEDEQECAKYDLASLLDAPTVKERWQGPARVLEIMAGRGGERDQEIARFNLYDAAELGDLQHAISRKECSGKALMFLRRLGREASEIKRERDAGVPAEVAAEHLDVPHSRLLVDALNRRRNYSVENVLGISADGLKDIFLELRRGLKNEKRRLVLLLEDITAWEGLDTQLVDVLVTDSTTRPADDLCDMVSVVGLTPDYMRSQLRTNYTHRITHSVTIGRQSTEQFLETTQLSTQESRERFVANYLRAVRAGLNALDNWKEQGAKPDALPNRCHQCPVRPGCHEAFGANDGVGLYPFTPRALSRMFEALEKPGMTLKTPRGMIQGVLYPVLREAEAINGGTFPPQTLEASDWLPEDVTQAPGILMQTLRIMAGGNEHTLERLRRLIMLWGDPDSAYTQGIGKGQLAGVPIPVFEAFGLPLPGEDMVDDPEPTPTPEPPPEREPPLDKLRPDDNGPQAEDPAPPTGRSNFRGRNEPPSEPRRRRRPPLSVESAIRQLTAWREGRKLESLPQWEAMLVDLVRRVPRHHRGVPQRLFDMVISERNVKFESEARPDARYFVVPKEEWLLLGLEAHVRLGAGRDLVANNEDQLRRLHARMMRRLGEEVRSHLQRRLPALDDGTAWPVAASIAQVLLARAWLRGETSPEQPLVDQFVCLLSDEGNASTNPKSRVSSWQALLTATDRKHSWLRDLLRELLSLSQGGASTFGLADAGAVAKALFDMRETLRLWPAPKQIGKGLERLEEIADLVRKFDEAVKHLPRYEGERLRGRARTVEAYLRGRSLREHARRVDFIVSAVGKHLVNAAPDETKRWYTEYRKVQEQGFFEEVEDAGARRVETFLCELDEAASEPQPDQDLAVQLSRVAAAPAAELEQAREFLGVGEMAVKRLYEYARSYVQSSGSVDADPARVRDFGRRIQSAANTMVRDLEEQS